jgi:hypothetical protein
MKLSKISIFEQTKNFKPLAAKGRKIEGAAQFGPVIELKVFQPYQRLR